MYFAQDWRARAKAIKSLAPQPSEPCSAELEKLLTKDPYEVLVKIKKEEGNKTKAKNPAIQDSTSDAPTESRQSSPVGSNIDHGE